MVYSFDSRVRYSEVDENMELSMLGVMNYFQDCSTFQSEDLGLGISWLEKKRRAWWLSSWQIDAARYPVLGERIRVCTWAYGFRGFYGYRNFAIQDQEGAFLVKADSLWFYYDLDGKRPVRPQAADVGPYGAGDTPRLEMEPMSRKIRMPEPYAQLPPVPAVRHHIDTNHHVNNAQYVEIVREILPEPVRIEKLEVEYRKAAVLGDVFCPRLHQEGNTTTVSLCDETGTPYAIVQLTGKPRRMPGGTGACPEQMLIK